MPKNTYNCPVVPFTDRVVIRPIKTEVTPGGIVLPEAAKDKITEGLVIAAGPGKPDSPGSRPDVGDTVYYSSYAGHTIEINGEKLLFLRFDEVFAKKAS
jgi:chaperonin GroES